MSFVLAAPQALATAAADLSDVGSTLAKATTEGRSTNEGRGGRGRGRR